MIKSGYKKKKRNVLRCCMSFDSDSVEVTGDGILFQKLAPETGKFHLPMVQQLGRRKLTKVSAGVACQLHVIGTFLR